ncbi:MAG: HIRAN domain-containing protein [Lachnospiraceae bacterium]|nr:HIRAN domain-containing protein [Lachnospiraceae bacterium]
MANELSLTGQQTMLDILHGANTDVPMNPFEKEIKLATFMVAGSLYGEQLRRLAVKQHEGTDVKLFREPENPDDPYAIRIEAVGRMIGYMPSELSEIPSNLMDAGKFIYGKVKKCSINYAGADIIVDLFMRG